MHIISLNYLFLYSQLIVHWLFICVFLSYSHLAEPHSSVDSVADLRAGGHWFDLQLGQHSFRGLMIVIATGFIPLSPLSVVSTMVIWESSQWLGKKFVKVLVDPFPHNDTF